MANDRHPVLFICDMQTKFRSTIQNFDKVEASINTLIAACNLISIPILLTTQNKEKLGNTVPSILSLMPKDAPQIDKTLFSMLTDRVEDWTQRSRADEVVLVGIETHICVAQTASALQALGYNVTVLADAVSSSSTQESKQALSRLQAKGINVTSLEAWLFETVKDATHARFPELSALLKRTKSQRSESIKALL